MNLVPTHLQNTQHFLTQLHNVPPDKLKGLTFNTADVEALYTNIKADTAIEDILEFATDHKQHLSLCGLTLTDVHELLEVTLMNSYFIYDRQIYHQLQGLFMGSRPAPIAATIRMWKLEKLSIYTDLRIKPLFYGRFYDDLNTGSLTDRKARLMCNAIEAQDKDRLIKLKVDYPESRETFTPFLNVEVKIDREGTANTRLYRKPQKKLLTLHAESQHPTSVKSHTIATMYKTAADVSSNDTNKLHSKKMVDELLRNNGYSQRVLDRMRNKKKHKNTAKRPKPDTVATLSLPHLTDQCTAQIRRAAEQYKIPVRVISKPGRKLKNMLTSSKPLDERQCPNTNCTTCEALDKGKCTDRNLVYQVTCELDNCRQAGIGVYNGETYRPIHDRYTEHVRSANNPTAVSYKEKPLAKHYTQQHPGSTPKLSLKILEKASSTNNRKIREARLITKNKPDLNDRDEQAAVRQYLV